MTGDVREGIGQAVDDPRCDDQVEILGVEIGFLHRLHLDPGISGLQPRALAAPHFHTLPGQKREGSRQEASGDVAMDQQRLRRPARSTIQHPFPYQPRPVLSGRKATDPIALPVTSWMRATSMVLRSSSPGRNRSGTVLPSSS